MNARYTIAIALAASLCSGLAAKAGEPEADGALFERLDRDGDGKLSPQELRRPLLFRILDANGDGWVTREEAKNAIRKRILDAAAEPDIPGVKLHSDIRYATAEGVDPKRLSLDVYTPEKPPNGAAKRPVMIFVHGGGWRLGDKSAVNAKPAYFIGGGYVFVSVNYRFVPAGRHPVNVQDVARAIAWVHGNIARYGGDPDAICIMGHSAGAHLVALVATDERHLKAAGKDLSVVKGVIPLDTRVFDVGKIVKTSIIGVYRNAFGDDPKLWEDASPIRYVAPGKGIPPFLIVYAGPAPSRKEAATEMAGALRKAGIRAEVHHAAGKNHMTLNREFGLPDDKPTQAATRFLDSLRKKPAGPASR